MDISYGVEVMDRHWLRVQIIGICNRLTIGDCKPFQDGKITRLDNSCYGFMNDEVNYAFADRTAKQARDLLIDYFVTGELEHIDLAGNCDYCNKPMYMAQSKKRFCCNQCRDAYGYRLKVGYYDD